MLDPEFHPFLRAKCRQFCSLATFPHRAIVLLYAECNQTVLRLRMFLGVSFCLPSFSVAFVPTFGDYQRVIGMKCYFSSLAQYANGDAYRSRVRVQKIACGFDLIHGIGENLGGVMRSHKISMRRPVQCAVRLRRLKLRGRAPWWL